MEDADRFSFSQVLTGDVTDGYKRGCLVLVRRKPKPSSAPDLTGEPSSRRIHQSRSHERRRTDASQIARILRRVDWDVEKESQYRGHRETRRVHASAA